MSAVSKLYIWRDRGLFLCAQHIPVRDFTLGSDQLLVCLKGQITRRFDSHPPVAFRSVLMRAGMKIPMKNVDAADSVIALCHLDPVGQDYHALKEKMTLEVDGNFFHHQDEDHIINELQRINSDNLDEKAAYSALDRLIIPETLKNRSFVEFDQRTVTALRLIEATVRDNISIATIASKIFLSESRLVKLFKSQIGIPITRYRLRYRVFVGLIYFSLGASVTEAALAAGFSSTAHFSKCFSAMIGIPPSSIFLHPPFLDVILADDILATIKKSA